MDINRRTAYYTLIDIETGKAYSNIALNRQIEENKPDSPSLVREMVYGVTENKLYLDYILDQLIPKGVHSVKKNAHVLLRLGLYQIIYMDSVPDYAAVDETVKMARKFCYGKDRFINGVLRSYCRMRDDIVLPDPEEEPLRYLCVKYSFADWIVKLWLEQYGFEKTEEILAASNTKPRVSIRVNLMEIGVAELRKTLEDRGFVVSHGRYSDRALFVKGHDLLLTPEYAKGYFAVQDESSIVAAEVVAPKTGETVIDVCAGPGGKTTAMAEIMGNNGKIISCDIYEKKIEQIKEEAARLGITILDVRLRDASEADPELAESADKVLCDVPCSGLGVIRRKPEIKYKVIEDNGLELSKLQYQILEASSTYVKQGGFLVYSTCTVNKIENIDVVSRFLQNHKEYDLIRSRQLLQGVDETDGFFICKMRRRV